jgi:hypothetical protein
MDVDSKNKLSEKEEIMEMLPYAVLIVLMWLLALCLVSYIFLIGAMPVY